MQEISKQIVTVLQNDSQLQTLLGGGIDKRIYPALDNSVAKYPCITYSEIDGMENTVPHNTQQSTFQISIFTKTSKSNLESINARVKTLLKYYSSDSPKILWVRKSVEQDQNETDRQMFSKILRYIIWSNILT